MKNSSNTILIVVIVIVLGVAGYFIFKPKPDNTTVSTEGGNGSTLSTDSTNQNVDAIKTSNTPKTSICGYLKYKRDDNDPIFKLLNDQELYINPDSFVNKMRIDGHSDEFISFAAAFLKGMDLALKNDIVKRYSKDISDFKAKAEIRRDKNFRNELQQQVYDVGSLVCDTNLLMAFSK